MNNFALFACGLVVTLMSGMGVLVYIVTASYQKEEEKRRRRKIETDAALATTSAVDLGAINKSLDSFVGIPSVS